MPDIQSARSGFIDLDLHSHYVVIVGVDSEGHQALGPRRIRWTNFQGWAQQHLTPQDAVVLEMTTNALTVYDEISPQVHSVTVVHPPYVALVARARGKTDRKAALILPQLHAAGLLPQLWVPPKPAPQLRALVAQRAKMVRLAT